MELADVDKIDNRWKAYYSELFNFDTEDHHQSGQERDENEEDITSWRG